MIKDNKHKIISEFDLCLYYELVGEIFFIFVDKYGYLFVIYWGNCIGC